MRLRLAEALLVGAGFWLISFLVEGLGGRGWLDALLGGFVAGALVSLVYFAVLSFVRRKP
ncbi:hypothetical protein [Meiothermus granaticius]|uniref:Uncharacterized protein n=1 Tax=Meiothermus granaticius NBRC 107808 TaxID=1227551 RepID=A0A399FBY6_9DEIN|nr:hypothetical protein [Meiothermus granaticius]MCL6525865.1 hypothetical protein [Thermaceae bacterium]RIH92201.1 hypothetical protein Mgrana_01870 [Meiothermus granaticius NBRC 107808]GEM85621.1 hypothetical protein MGR01S_02460 [Meiothermus granaticius NBRC 107808]